uniref:Uncharacterized protein n=1 Tax=Steinernema glaseri TaxID=37863 RepID=A0A1I7ZX91_9BILA
MQTNVQICKPARNFISKIAFDQLTGQLVQLGTKRTRVQQPTPGTTTAPGGGPKPSSGERWPLTSTRGGAEKLRMASGGNC